MGRPTLWSTRGLSPDSIIATYEAAPNLEVAATQLDICEKTLRNWLDTFGYGRKRGFPKGVSKRDTSCLSEWIRSHPGEPLPTSIAAIARLTGCTTAAVTSYLHRRRESLEARVRAVPDLRLLKATLKVGETSLPTANIAHYTVYVRDHSERLKVAGTLRDGRAFALHTTIEALEQLGSTDPGE